MLWNSFSKLKAGLLVALICGSAVYFYSSSSNKNVESPTPSKTVLVSPSLPTLPVVAANAPHDSAVSRSTASADAKSIAWSRAPLAVKSAAEKDVLVVQDGKVSEGKMLSGTEVPVDYVTVEPATDLKEMPPKEMPPKEIPPELYSEETLAVVIEEKTLPAQSKTPAVVEVSQKPPTPVIPDEDTEVEYQGPPSGLVKEFWLWGSWGPSFSSVNQTVPGLSNIDFGGLGSASTSLLAGFWITDDIGLNLTYRDSPGEAKSSSTVAVTNGKYHWRTATVEGLVRSSKNVAAHSTWNFRAGVQQTQVPFLVPLNSNALDLTQASITNITLGVEYKKLIREKLRLEWLLRYQHPVSSSADLGASLTVTPKFSFETSLGAAYQLGSNTSVGIYWYNQYQNFSFKYENPAAMSFSGSQSTFFSTFDLRLGIEF